MKNNRAYAHNTHAAGAVVVLVARPAIIDLRMPPCCSRLQMSGEEVVGG